MGIDASLAVARARDTSVSRVGRKRARSAAAGAGDEDMGDGDGGDGEDKAGTLTAHCPLPTASALLPQADPTPTTRSDPLYHKKLRGQIASKTRFFKMDDLRGY
jgi:hypothetical protein